MNAVVVFIAAGLCITQVAALMQDVSNTQQQQQQQQLLQPHHEHSQQLDSSTRQLLQHPAKSGNSAADTLDQGAVDEAASTGTSEQQPTAAAAVPLPVAASGPDPSEVVSDPSIATDTAATPAAAAAEEVVSDLANDPREVMVELGIALHTPAAAVQMTPGSNRRANRCSTPALPKAAKAAVELQLKHAVQASSFDTVVVAGPTAPIPVHWHILRWNGLGDVTEAMLNVQMRVINTAFLSAGIAFRASTSTTYRYSVTAAMFNAMLNSTEERDFKGRYRRGIARDLNIYTWSPGDGTLGWATFPFDYTSNRTFDGVVVSWRTIPGVCTARPALCTDIMAYSLGDTVVHEVRRDAACRAKGELEAKQAL